MVPRRAITAGIAEALAERIGNAGHDVTPAERCRRVGRKDCATATTAHCSAARPWGTDEVEMAGRLQHSVREFDAIGASGKKAACFASGDSSFEHFCGAVDVIEKPLSGLGAVIMEEGLKVDGDYSGNKDDVDAWCDRIIEDL